MSREGDKKMVAVNKANNIIYQWLTSFAVWLLAWLVSYVSILVNDYGLLALYLGLWVVFATALFIASKRKRKLWLIYLKDESPWKGRLSGGFFMYATRLMIAAPIAFFFLLTLSLGLNKTQWLILLVMALLWPFALCFWSAWSQRHIKEQAQIDAMSTSARLCFLLVFIAIFSSYTLLAIELPNLQDVSLQGAFDYGLKLVAKELQPRSEVLTVILAYASAIKHVSLWFLDFLNRHLYSTGFSSAKLSYAANAALWLMFAIQSALFIWPILLLSRAAILLPLFSSSENRFILSSGKAAFIAVYAGIFIAVSFAGPSISHLWKETRCIVIDTEDACYEVTADELGDALMHAFEKLTPAQKVIANRLVERSNRHINVIFGSAIENVPTYLDWHYSFGGKFTLIVADANEKMDEQLFPNGGIAAAYERVANSLNNAIIAEQDGLFKQLKTELAEQLSKNKQHPHAAKSSNKINLELESAFQDFVHIYRQEQTKAQLQALGAVGVGMAATALAVGGKKSVQAIAKQSSKQVAKQGAKRAATGKAGALGCVALAPTGPLMLLCGATVFIVTTAATEYAEIQYDQYRNRQDLHLEMVSSLGKMKAAMQQNMQMHILGLFPESYEELAKRIQEGVFETPLEKVKK